METEEDVGTWSDLQGKNGGNQYSRGGLRTVSFEILFSRIQ